MPTDTKKKDEVTCVQLSKKTRDELAKLGTRKDTYEKIIRGLMNTPCSKKV